MMSMMTSISEAKREIEFVERVAEDFGEHPEHYTYGDMRPGSLLALRWGMDDDCILVVKLDESFENRNYQQAIKRR